MQEIEKVELLYSDIIANQATINIGCIGHVSEGKSTVVRSLTGTTTQRHKKEQDSNRTIKLGYANFKIWYDPDRSETYHTPSNITELLHPVNKNKLTLVKHVSFVDCPGHETFMATMVSGTSVMDAAILLIGANNETVPQRQTHEHLKALNKTDVKDVLVLQNKVDLLKSEEEAIANRDKIVNYLKTIDRESVIMPVSAQYGTNMDQVCSYITNNIQQRDRNLNQDLFLPIIRSFDVNKPGITRDELKGGIIGGSVSKGVLRVGDYVEIRPGVEQTIDGKRCFTPLITQVESIKSETNEIKYAIPGGLIGIGTNLDPYLCGANRLVGQVLGHPGRMPNVYEKLKIDFEDFLVNNMSFLDFKRGESIVMCVNNYICKATITPGIKATTIIPVKPICCKTGQKMAIFQDNYGKFNLVAIAKITSGTKCSEFVLPENYDSYKSAKQYEYTLKYDLPESCSFERESFDYETMLQRFTFVNKVYKLQVPIPKVQRENKRVYLVNAMDIIRCVHKDHNCDKSCFDYKDLFLTYFNNELLKTCRYSNDDYIIIEGIFRPQQIESIVRKYINYYVLCKTCNSFNTGLSRVGQTIKCECRDCTTKISVD